jgi:hypothetical protein
MVFQLSRGCDGTLLSFSINVLDSLRLVGVPILTGQDEIAFLHLWRYISYLIGVRDHHDLMRCLPAHLEVLCQRPKRVLEILSKVKIGLEQRANDSTPVRAV